MNPLEVIEDLISDSTITPELRLSAAKALAEYTHAKRPPVGTGQDVQQVTLVMQIGDAITRTNSMVE